MLAVPVNFAISFSTGFDDWKNAPVKIISHAALSMILQGKKSTRIDAEIQKENKNFCIYWTEILRRIIAVIKLLAERRFIERGLVFCGDIELHNSPDNLNYHG